ncbi:MAG: hypothetical protein P8174_04425, partial [Gemmatimonadota bacterium]
LLTFVGALALVAVAAWGWLRPGPQPLASRQTIKLGSVDFPSGIALGMAIAPDGSAIVFPDSVGNAPQLWIKERGELDPRMLAKMSSVNNPPGPAFSPDGKWIVYTDGNLKKVARGGGAPMVLSDSGASYGAAWLDDGTIAFIGSNGDGLYTTTAEGAPAKRVKLVTGADSVDGPFVRLAPIPGRDAVFLGIGTPYDGEVAVDLATGAEHPLTRGGIGAWIVPGGDVVYAQANGALFAAPFDMHGLTLEGAPVSVVDHVRMTTGMADANMGADGTLLYIQGATTNNAARRQLVAVGRDGTVTPMDTAWTVILGQNGGADLSPDGTRFAITESDSTDSRSDIYIVHLPDGPATRLTFNGTRNVRPTWSPDGRRILYASDAGGKMELWTRHADGSGRPLRVVSEPRPVWEGHWSPDGRWIVYRTDNGAPGNGDILAIPTQGDTTPVPLVATEAQETTPTLSPDGHWLAYISDTSGRFEVYVRPFPDAQDGLWQVSNDGGSEPRWSHDGKELFYRNARGRMIAVEVSTTPTFAVGARRTLFNTGPYDRTDYGHYYDIAPDDDTFLMFRSVAFGAAQAGRLVLVRNWLQELRAKLGR